MINEEAINTKNFDKMLLEMKQKIGNSGLQDMKELTEALYHDFHSVSQFENNVKGGYIKASDKPLTLDDLGFMRSKLFANANSVNIYLSIEDPVDANKAALKDTLEINYYSMRLKTSANPFFWEQFPGNPNELFSSSMEKTDKLFKDPSASDQK